MRLVPGRAVVLAAASLVLFSGCNHAAAGHAGAPTTTSTTTAAGAHTYRGTAQFTGTLTAFRAPDALTDPIPTPFTLTVPDAGRGGFTITGADIDGDEETIVWSGGRPLPVTGTCGLDVGEVPVVLTPAGATFAIDGGARALTAGDCMFNSSVAVGNGGLAEPVPSVSFLLHTDAAFKPTGGTSVTVGPVRRYEGHRGAAEATGTFTVTTQRGDTWRATRVTLGNGTWILDVTKAASGALAVQAQFSGDLTVA
ncbi:MAG TPA: hypothetical protein VHC63_16975 [Acidimicrobiales bacterium]|nr:hypothetical protein [Acidimicrobiales bacterium]